jgi:diguanylate cyclase (GGDEF)-like protein/PAS domain S-box-containing protein
MIARLVLFLLLYLGSAGAAAHTEGEAVRLRNALCAATTARADLAPAAIAALPYRCDAVPAGHQDRWVWLGLDRADRIAGIDGKWHLLIDQTRFQALDILVVHHDGTTQRIRRGATGFGDNWAPGGHLDFVIDRPGREIAGLYIGFDRIDHLPLMRKVDALDEHAYDRLAREWLLLIGLFAGVLGVSLAYNLFLAVGNRRFAFQRWYVAWATSALLYGLFWTGVGFAVVPGLAGPFGVRANYVLVAALAASGMCLFTAFIEEGKLPRWFSRVSHMLSVALMLAGAAAAADRLVPASLTDRLLNLLFVASMVLVAAGAVHAIRVGSRAVWFYLAGWAIPLTVFVARIARNFQALPQSDIIDMATFATMALESVVLSLAIADRFRLLHAEQDAAEALRASEARYRRFFEVSSTRFWTADPSGTIRLGSRDVAERYGIARDIGTDEERHLPLHPDDRATADEHWARSLRDSTPLDVTLRLRRTGESYRWMRLRAWPELANGVATGWYGITDDVHERQLAKAALIESEERFRRLADDAPVMFWLTGSGGDTEYISRGWIEFTGQPMEEAAGRGWTAAIHPIDVPRLHAAFETYATHRKPFELDFRLRRADGTYRWVFNTARPRFGENGVFLGYVGTLADIHDRKQAEHALGVAQERLTLALDGTGVGVWDWTAHTGRTWFSPSAYAMIGYPSPGDGDSLFDAAQLIHPDDLECFEQHFAEMTNASGDAFSCEIRMRHANGHWIWIADRGVVVARGLDGRATRIVGTIVDITERREAEERLRWMTHHDTLTGLPNRVLFRERLDVALRAAGRDGSRVGLALLDLDHFKSVNDALGHAAGDQLLATLAERLRMAVPDGELVARLGGDEFTVVLPGIADETALETALATILERLTEPFVYDGHVLDCRGSFGAALYPDHATTSSDLLKNADLAMYMAKSFGRGGIALFSESLRAVADRRVAVAAQVRDALAEERIEPFYQPKIDMRSGAIIGFEALLRVRHRSGRVQGPGAIAAAFEDLDLAEALGERMLDRVVADMRSWLDRGLEFGPVAINASAAEFRRDGFAETLIAKLEAAAIPTSLIQVEVTETVFLGRGAERVERALRRLSEAGVTIALDDFGTGFASLAHLKRYPIDALKIDQSFVRDVEHDQDDAAIVRAVIGLAAGLGLDVIAEGVETVGQVDFLLAEGCPLAQGFLYHEPMPAQSAARLLDAWSEARAAG